MGHQPRFTTPAAQGLDSGFVVEQRGDDVAIVGTGLLPHHHPVPIADGGVDHGIPAHLQHKKCAISDQLLRQGEDVFHLLLGEYGPARRDPAQQGRLDGLRM